MSVLLRVVAIGTIALLAACGRTEPERTQGGALAGAATGAGVGALGEPVGAVVGGGAGAVTGAATSPNQLNLGKPVYDNPNVVVPTPSGPVSPSP